jgi:hypothetical protein
MKFAVNTFIDQRTKYKEGIEQLHFKIEKMEKKLRESPMINTFLTYIPYGNGLLIYSDYRLISILIAVIFWFIDIYILLGVTRHH